MSSFDLRFIFRHLKKKVFFVDWQFFYSNLPLHKKFQNWLTREVLKWFYDSIFSLNDQRKIFSNLIFTLTHLIHEEYWTHLSLDSHKNISKILQSETIIILHLLFIYILSELIIRKIVYEARDEVISNHKQTKKLNFYGNWSTFYLFSNQFNSIHQFIWLDLKTVLIKKIYFDQVILRNKIQWYIYFENLLSLRQKNELNIF